MVQVLVRLTRIDPNNRTTVRNPISTSVKLPVSHRATAQPKAYALGELREWAVRGLTDGSMDGGKGQMRQPAQPKGEREQPEKLERRQHGEQRQRAVDPRRRPARPQPPERGGREAPAAADGTSSNLLPRTVHNTVY